jgi:hypothetical protein
MKITQICITVELVRGLTAILEPVKRLGQKHFVHVTPAPVLSGFKGLHNGMLGLMKVLGGVFIFGRVTAPDVTADETFPQVNPGIAHFEALLAALAAGLDLADLFDVRTSLGLRHASSESENVLVVWYPSGGFIVSR